ncbi:hypothetical protein PLESTM_001564300 [Pleodorina starrii]|nr:hypothetical protein PLESTM_001564300 [Pleodorina starrii]
MNRATVPLSTSRSSLASKALLAHQVRRHTILASATLSAAKPSGSVEHSHRDHGDFDSTHVRAGAYNITFETTSGAHVIKAQKGANIYNAADHAGLHLPASCQQGSCSSCVGKVLDGRVTHSHEPQCLTPSLKAQGYVALCCASVVGDATILTHQGAKLRAARALQLDRMRHNLG